LNCKRQILHTYETYVIHAIIFLEINLGGYPMTQSDKKIKWKSHFDAWKASGLSVVA